MLPFVGVDGEGGNVDREDGTTDHQYMMLRIGDTWWSARPEHTPPEHWLKYIIMQPKRHIYASFWFDYDVTMMLRHMPEDEIRFLLLAGEVQHGSYRINYRPRKEFTVRGYGTIRTINDVGTFFQCSFVDALTRWGIGTPDQVAMIRAGKDQRNTFGQLTANTIAYNDLECRKLVELMNKFRSACVAIGYIPRMWQGPGQLAKAMLRKHGIPPTDKLPEPNLVGVWEAAQWAYYGGRFETSAVGPVPGPIDGWDIASAYPYATTLLPCLEHLTWKPSKEIRPNGLYRITYGHSEQTWYTLPHRRRDGSICYPREGGGWYWGVEILAAQRMGAKVSVKHGYEWVSTCGHKLFEFMHRLFSVRKAIGKSEAGLALKLAMNSVYGVTAQSVGRAPYANPVYAGLITAHTRTRLLDAMRHSPTDVYMVATDGLYCRSGSLPLDSSTSLGGWELTEYPSGMHIVQPGVYFIGDKTAKTRGIPYSAIVRERDHLIDAWKGNRDDGHDITLRQFIGLRIAAHRNRLDLAGQWIPTTKRISYDWSTKRQPGVLHRHDDRWRTAPYQDGGSDESTPYDRVIGNLARDVERLEWMDAPDWADRIGELI